VNQYDYTIAVPERAISVEKIPVGGFMTVAGEIDRFHPSEKSGKYRLYMTISESERGGIFRFDDWHIVSPESVLTERKRAASGF